MFRLALAVGAFLGSINTASAVRVLEDVENSAELTLSQIELPTSDTGMVTFKTCESCRTSVHRATTSTTYLVNGSQLRLADFLRAVDEIKAQRNGSEQTLVGVFFDLASGHVTRVALHTRIR